MNKTYRCAYTGCPVETVSFVPKDHGDGSDSDEIAGAMDGSGCPICGYDLTEEKANSEHPADCLGDCCVSYGSDGKLRYRDGRIIPDLKVEPGVQTGQLGNGDGS